MLKFIDLFCGIGGFHLAFQNLAECVFASDWDKYAQKTYKNNFSPPIFEGDINGVDLNSIPTYDILCAGFPCQPFSLAGSQQGFDHKTQGNLFFKIINIIEKTNPKVIFLENVKNLVSHDKGNTFKVICSALQNLNYNLKFKVLNATEYGNLPQNRERIYIVGFKDIDAYNRFDFPTKIQLKTKLFGDIINIANKAEEKLYQTNLDSPSVQRMLKGITQQNHIYQYRLNYVRQNRSGVCPTLTANMGAGGHNVPLLLDNFGVRKLSVEECFLLQGFPVPDTYKLPKLSKGHLYKQIGNSVPVPVVKRIAENIVGSL